MIQQKDVQVQVRDGAKIALRIYRPDTAGVYPALFAPSPYRYDNDDVPAYPCFLWRETGPIEWYTQQGYAYVRADVRGTGFSQGEYKFLDRQEQEDMYDVIEWIGTQPWCNGKVGGIGQSYFAMMQWFMGIQNPPHLACLGLYDGLNDPYNFMAYPGGIEGNFLYYWFGSSVRVPNLFPMNGDHPRELPHDIILDIERHPLYDEYWRERAAFEQVEKIKVPVFSIGVWAKQDLHLDGNLRGYQRLKSPKKMFVTGTATAFTSTLDFANVEFHKKHLLPFYDMYLKGQKTSYADRRNIEYAIRNTNLVRSLESWPPPNVRYTPFYFGEGPTGSVASVNDGALHASPEAARGVSKYAYPRPEWVLGVVAVGPKGPDPARGVLTFTSQPLPEDLEIVGYAKATLHFSTTGKDMDFMVKLSEQFPQSPEDRAAGNQPAHFMITKGWLRASHANERHAQHSTDDVPYYTHAKAAPLEPGKTYKIEIPLLPAAHIFKKGSRIRLEISNGDSPVTDTLFIHHFRPDKVGECTLFHDKTHPSHLSLPVVSTSGRG